MGPNRVIYKLEHSTSENLNNKGYLTQKNDVLYHPNELDKLGNPSNSKMVTISRVKFATDIEGQKILYKSQLQKNFDGNHNQAYNAKIAPIPAIIRPSPQKYNYYSGMSHKPLSDSKRIEFLTDVGRDLAFEFSDCSKTAFNQEAILTIIYQCLTNVNQLHTGNLGQLPPSLHRDIHPGNFCLRKNSPGHWQVTLIDFDESREIKNGQVIASPVATKLYTPPEILDAVKANSDSITMTVHLDIYALGKTLNYLLASKKSTALNENDRATLTQLSAQMFHSDPLQRLALNEAINKVATLMGETAPVTRASLARKIITHHPVGPTGFLSSVASLLYYLPYLKSAFAILPNLWATSLKK